MKRKNLISRLLVLMLCCQLVLPALASEIDSAPSESQNPPETTQAGEADIPETIPQETATEQTQQIAETLSETLSESDATTEAPKPETSLEDISISLPVYENTQGLSTNNTGLTALPSQTAIKEALSHIPLTYARTSNTNVLVSQIEMMYYINAVRMELNIDPLSLSLDISDAAMQRAYECSLTFNEAHDRPDGSAWYTIFDDYRLPWYTCGENIARKYYSAYDVMVGWLNSVGHRANILNNDFQTVGIGYYNDGTPYWAQDFIGGYNISSITLYGLDEDILLGSSLMETGAFMYVEYTNGMDGIIPLMDNMVTGYNSNQDGLQAITLSCLGYSLTTQITVVDPVKQFVTRLYTEILQRTPDSTGLNAWTNDLKSKKCQGAEVALGFINSDEFKDRNVSNEDYINILYRTFLNRTPDTVGLQGWLKDLDDGLSRIYIFRGFAESNEFTDICNQYGIIRGTVALTDPMDKNPGVTKFVVRCYRLCLDRNADKTGLNDWCDKIISKTRTPKEVAYGFIFSREFLSKDLSDKDYIRILYRTFLDREADSIGYADWTGKLQSGTSRIEIFNGFADSKEFGNICSSYGLN